MRRRCTVSAIALLLVTAAAFAQQPVTSPIYYLSTAPRLEVGIPVTGVLTESSGRNFKDGTYLDVLTLRGTAGDTIDLFASSGAFDTYLSLFAPDGSLVASNDDDPFGGTTDSALRAVRLPATGTYVVVVSGFGTWDVGPYTVELRSAGAQRADTVLVDVPSITSARLTGDAAGARFAVELGETMVLALAARSSAFDTTLELFDAFGYSLAYNDDAPGDTYTTDSALVALLPAGSYQIVVQPYFMDDVGDGAFELEVQRLVPAR